MIVLGSDTRLSNYDDGAAWPSTQRDQPWAALGDISLDNRQRRLALAIAINEGKSAE
jgi:hypothetical protein